MLQVNGSQALVALQSPGRLIPIPRVSNPSGLGRGGGGEGIEEQKNLNFQQVPGDSGAVGLEITL